MKHLIPLFALAWVFPAVADSYWCDNSIRARTLDVTWAECPRHSWTPYVKASYDGDYMGGEFHGQGTYTWKDDSVYSGNWSHSRMHGWGTLFFSNGDKYSGIWSNNRFVRGVVFTEGENCSIRLTSNYYLPAEDACYKD